MESGYIISYLQIFVSFTFVLYVYPRILFNKYLKNQSFFYKLFFCAGIMFCLTGIFMTALGIINFLNQIQTLILFFVPLIIKIIFSIVKYRKKNKIIIVDIKEKIILIITKIKNKLSNKKNWTNLILNFLILAIILVLIWHFGNYARTDQQIGNFDIKCHELWIDSFSHTIFYSYGLYPYGMHYIIYLPIIIFRLNTHTALLFAGSFTMLLFFAALYWWLKNTFINKETLLVFFILFLILTLSLTRTSDTLRMVYDGLHRFRWTLPQEFCLWAAFVAPLCVYKIICNKNNSSNLFDKYKYYILLSMCITTTLCTHFYTFAFLGILCISTFVIWLFKLKRKTFINLIIFSVIGFLIFFIPFGAAWLKIGKLSTPMMWSINLPSGNVKVKEAIAFVPSEINENAVHKFNGTKATGIDQFFHILGNNVIGSLMNNLNPFIVSLLLLASLISFIVLITNKDKMKNLLKYSSILLALFIFLIFYSAPAFGTLKIIESYRLIICIYTCFLALSSLSFDTGIFYFKGWSYANYKLYGLNIKRWLFG